MKNEAGDEVERFDFPIGAERLEWSGLDAQGNSRELGLYSFEVVSYSGDDILA